MIFLIKRTRPWEHFSPFVECNSEPSHDVVLHEELECCGVDEASHSKKAERVLIHVPVHPVSQRLKCGLFWYLFCFLPTPLTPRGLFSPLSRFSMDGFKALGFDPHTMQSSRPAGGPPPSQDALVCLHKLSSMVSQLLQAFSRYRGPLAPSPSFGRTLWHRAPLPAFIVALRFCTKEAGRFVCFSIGDCDFGDKV